MRVKILQWNVWFKENIECVTDVLESVDADIICLQELTQGYVEQTHENTWEYIRHRLGFVAHVQEIPINTGKTQWLQANAIFSRFPIARKHTRWLHTPVDDDDPHDQYRGYLDIVIGADDKHLTVGTTHMSFGTDKGDDHELQKLSKVIADRPERYVLTGDLNATPDSPRIAALMNMLNHAGPPLTENTWTTKPFHFPDFSATTLDWRYDYVFASRDVEIADARIIRTDISDHLPILVTVGI